MNLTKRGYQQLIIDEAYLFRALGEGSGEEILEVLRGLPRIAKILILLSHLSRVRGVGRSISRLKEITGMSRKEVQYLLDKLSGSTPESLNLVEARRGVSLRVRILRALELGWDNEIVYCLTKRGRRYTEMLC